MTTKAAIDVDAILSTCDFRLTARDSFHLCHGANTPHEAATAWASECSDQLTDWDGNTNDVEELAERLGEQWERVAKQHEQSGSDPEEWVAWVLGRVMVVEAQVAECASGFGEYQMGEASCVWMGSRGDGCRATEKDYVDSCGSEAGVELVADDSTAEIRKHLRDGQGWTVYRADGGLLALTERDYRR